MGSPELPVEDENNIDRPPVNSLPMHGINGIGGTSDDSDNENMDDAYAGYQPLAFDEDTMEYSVQMENNNEMDDDENDDYDYQSFAANSVAPEVGIEVPSIDAEVVTEIWNAPRSEITTIELDSTRAAQIMSVMANISIPTMSIPDWAQGVSEDKWKEDLLDRIRQRQFQPNLNDSK